MNCDFFKKHCSEALDNELPVELGSSFEAHLEACPSCRHQWDQFQDYRAAMRHVPSWMPSPQLKEQIRSIWRPSLRPASLFYLPNMIVHTWPSSLCSYRFAGILSGLVMASLVFLLFPIQVGQLPLQLERMMQTEQSALFVNTAQGLHPSLHLATMLGPQKNETEIYYNQESHAGSRRFSAGTVCRFTEFEGKALFEDSLTVLTYVTTDGISSIQGVLRTPRDRHLMQRFGLLLSDSQINSTGIPSANPGVVIWSFQRIIVTG